MRRIVSLILALLMLTSALVACGTPDATADETTEAVVTTEEVTEAETEAPIVMKEYDLSKFKIIYDGIYNIGFAQDLKARFKDTMGLNLSASGSNAKNEGEFEILIGYTHRAASASSLGEGSKYMDAIGIYCENGKMQILGRDDRNINASIEYFFENIVKEGTHMITMPEKGAMCEKVDVAEFNIPAKDDSHIRLVGNNILMQCITYSQDRFFSIADALPLYGADIFAFQEADTDWNTKFELNVHLKNMGFELAPAYALEKYNFRDIDNYNPIYYKTSRFNLIASGYEEYDQKGLCKDRKSYSWAVLEDKKTEKQFLVTSTHYIWSMNDNSIAWSENLERSEAFRQESSKQLLAAIAELRKQYPEVVAVISSGDYNCVPGSEPYAIMNAQMKSARDTAEVLVNMEYPTCNTLGNAPVLDTSYALDHVFYTGAVEAKRFETVISPYTYAYSDHVPVFFDFVLN